MAGCFSACHFYDLSESHVPYPLYFTRVFTCMARAFLLSAAVNYDNILLPSDDPGDNDVIRFLREREIVHFQQFGDA